MIEFGADYFERGIENNISCYTNYHWLPELTFPMVMNMIDFLGIDKGDKILDFGCAKGYVVKAFCDAGYDAVGTDVSSYAVTNSPSDVIVRLHVQTRCDDIVGGPYDWVICKDVLEHINKPSLKKVLKKLHRKCVSMFVAVPLGDGSKYVVPAYELDKTHKIRESLNWWGDAFSDAGFRIVKNLFQVKGIKDNWSSWKKGNGFFVLSGGAE